MWRSLRLKPSTISSGRPAARSPCNDLRQRSPIHHLTILDSAERRNANANLSGNLTLPLFLHHTPAFDEIADSHTDTLQQNNCRCQQKPLDVAFHLCNYLSMHNPLAQIAVFALVAAIVYGVKWRK